MTPPAERIQELERQLRDMTLDLAVANRLNATLQHRADAHEMRGQDVANKWRTRNQALAVELQLAQVGLTSGCGCPIGECQQRGADQGECWMLWAEAHVLKRMANMRIGEMQNASRHPSRFRAAAIEGKAAPRLASPEPQPGD